jgi:hypothetical protein
MLFASYLPIDFLQRMVKLEFDGERLLKGKVHSGLEYQTIGRRLSEVSFIYANEFYTCMFPTHIAGFLVYFESELLKRAHKNFSFINGR